METLVNKLHLTPEGEKQKHMMIASKNNIKVVETSTDKQTVKFELLSDALIFHDEHGTIKLEEGTYEKTNQVEFNPFDNTVAYVFD
jgi:hypothetical protein